MKSIAVLVNKGFSACKALRTLSGFFNSSSILVCEVVPSPLSFLPPLSRILFRMGDRRKEIEGTLKSPRRPK